SQIELGEPAPEVESARAVRERPVMQRIEADHPAPGGLEQLDGLGVLEGEGATACDCDDRLAVDDAHLGGGVPAVDVQIRSRARHLEDRLEVDVSGDVVTQPLDEVSDPVALRRRDESEMA